MKKRFTLVVFLSFVSALYLGAQPKIAVLDATVGQGVSINASAIVADTINEQFVKAPQYTALDRAYISSVQEEKKFQLSGDVNEQDIKDIGNTFGADYLCVANVSLLGSTYTVSARLIEVSTAEVFSQESHRMRGEIDILFMIAEIVGAELVGVDLTTAVSVPLAETTPEPEPALQPEPEPEPQPEPAPQLEPVTQPRQERQTPRSYSPSPARGHLMISWMWPNYTGAKDSFDDGYAFYELEEYYEGSYDTSLEHIGIDIHYMEPAFRFIYYSLGFTYTEQIVTAERSSSTYEWDNFSTYEPYVGLGAVISPTSFVQLYGGITLGAMILVLGTDYAQDQSVSYWGDNAGEVAAGVTLGLEIGATLYWGPFGLDLRYKAARSGELTGDVIFSDDAAYEKDFGHRGFMVGVGFMF